MKKAQLSIRELSLIAGTRAVAGAGLGLLLADRIPSDRRKTIGWSLLAVGALSTIPLAIDVIRSRMNGNETHAACTRDE
ncbi:MAG TPA: hypothetical protein VL992_14025 [Tepidisphaeraceae bacterium]|nr:hypothetical protein [Tepidisphaeraceae bacterium]